MKNFNVVMGGENLVTNKHLIANTGQISALITRGSTDSTHQIATSPVLIGTLVRKCLVRTKTISYILLIRVVSFINKKLVFPKLNATDVNLTNGHMNFGMIAAIIFDTK